MYITWRVNASGRARAKRRANRTLRRSIKVTANDTVYPAAGSRPCGRFYDTTAKQRNLMF